MIGIIFDLDGTLVDSYDIDEKIYREAVLSEVPGARLRSSVSEYQYSTDVGILAEILGELNLPVQEYHDLVRQCFGRLFKDHIQSGNSCKAIPGASALLNRLFRTPDVRIGIATGGWGHTARMKLEAAGLGDLDVPIASCDEAHSRREIMQICANRMETSISSFAYVGDEEWDLRAANRLGWKFVGVGPRLEGKCDIWVPDLCHATPFLELL